MYLSLNFQIVTLLHNLASLITMTSTDLTKNAQTISYILLCLMSDIFEIIDYRYVKKSGKYATYLFTNHVTP
jgi:hypothetical protein